MGREKRHGAAPAEDTVSPGPAEQPEAQASADVWICPRCKSSYRVAQEAVAIQNHKNYRCTT